MTNKGKWLGLITALLVIAILFHYLPSVANPSHSIRQADFRTLWTREIRKQIATTPILEQDLLIFGT
ncbi:MAG: hypothetical protein JWM96_1393, partial [Alphaproteobacteria bacterium]|nr:hypothetical protein [Alphaproteobacteria bacterium]